MAKIGQMLGFGDNPFYEFFDSNRNVLSGALGGAAADPKNPWGGAAKGAAEGRQADDAYAKVKAADAERLEGINTTTEWLRTQSGSNPLAAELVSLVDGKVLSPVEAVTTFYDQTGTTGTADWSRLNDGSLYNQRTGEVKAVGEGGAAQPNISTQAQWGYDPETQTMVMGQLADNGSFVKTDMGGLQPVTPFDLNSSKAAGTAYGKPAGADLYDLPDTIAKGETSINQLWKLLPEDAQGKPVSNAGFEEEFGSTMMIPNSKLPVWDRTPRADFQAQMDQVQGQAFLQGIEQMKGTGAISEAEGSKATQAIMRASTAQTREAFISSIKEAIGIIDAGLARAKQKAAAGPTIGNAAASMTAPAGDADYQTRYGLD